MLLQKLVYHTLFFIKVPGLLVFYVDFILFVLYFPENFKGDILGVQKLVASRANVDQVLFGRLLFGENILLLLHLGHEDRLDLRLCLFDQLIELFPQYLWGLRLHILVCHMEQVLGPSVNVLKLLLRRPDRVKDAL